MPNTRFTYSLCGLASLTVLVYCYWPTAISFDSRWNTQHEAYSHGYLLLGLCALLVVRQLPTLRHTPRKPFWLAIGPLLLFSLVWLFGRVTNLLVLQQLALPAIGLLSITTIYGLETGKLLRFPFLLFYAAVPVWDVFNGLLQQITVKICTLGLKLVGIPAFIEETQISIPAGTFQVAGGCSGLNYLLMIGTIAAVYGHLYYRRLRHKILLLVVAAAFGLLCNWIRVLSLVLVGHASNMQSELLGDHEILGWVAFTICLIPFLYLAMHIETRDKMVQPTTPPPITAEKPDARWFAFLAAATATAILGPLLFYSIETRTGTSKLADILESNQSALINYARERSWEPAYRNSDEHLILQLPGNNAQLQVHIVSYFTQEQGKELIQWGNELANGQQWQLISDKSLTSPQGGKHRVATLQSPINQAEVLYWYAVGKYFTNSPVMAKWYQFLSFLQGREDAALLAIFYPCPNINCAETRLKATRAAPTIQQVYKRAMNHIIES